MSEDAARIPRQAGQGTPLFQPEALERIRAAEERWESTTVAEFIRKTPERFDPFTTLSELPLKRIYTPADVADLDYSRDLGLPGEFPFTRGPYPTMYRGRTWTHRQIAGFGQAQDTNQRFRFLLAQGQTGLSIDFDQPTLTGYDSDHPMAAGEVGRVGVAIDSVGDMDELLAGIPLDKISISMTINHPAPILYAMLLAVAERRGVPWDELAGTIQFDVLKEFISQKTFVFPPRGAMRLVRDLIAFASRHTPRWNIINVSGYHTRDAGATAIQELAFTLAAGREYVRTGVSAGVPVDEFAPRISFFFNCQMDFLEEIAKFRAARRMWARMVRDEFGARKPESMRLKFHCQTAGAACTAQQPMVNIIRVAIQALAAVLGGCQSLHTNGFDEALSIPTEMAMELALRTQQVIANETGVTSVVDPLGGSYAIESLTNRIEAEAWKLIREMDERGGYIRCIENGWFARQIADSAYNFQMAKEKGRRVVVGVNKYVKENEETNVEIHKVDPAVEERQRERLAALRASRDNGRVAAALAAIEQAARGDENLMPLILAAVKLNATEGEIIGALKAVFGSHTEIPVL